MFGFLEPCGSSSTTGSGKSQAAIAAAVRDANPGFGKCHLESALHGLRGFEVIVLEFDYDPTKAHPSADVEKHLMCYRRMRTRGSFRTSKQSQLKNASGRAYSFCRCRVVECRDWCRRVSSSSCCTRPKILGEACPGWLGGW